MPKPRKPKIINVPGYVGPERRFRLDRRRGIDRRKMQTKPVEGLFEREFGRNVAEDWLPPRIKVSEERSGKERRSGKDRRQK